ncbi:hypothetical protein N7449_009442 [Penicillium cf. viridicatum]|uniref:Alcohol dehydrogenase n=1 Tax=Penicillium cf. viridicatum TaxID=2972119 RepID=A0A9W9M8K9_9EURO|nr:hypothetical protein N7449_009442 [Penicillium cf. viridicatum]
MLVLVGVLSSIQHLYDDWSSGIKIGDRNGVKWVASACGNCEPCQKQSDSLCFNQKVSGYYTLGTFQQYILGLTAYSALKRSMTAPGQWAVISGAGGGLGHPAVQIARKGMGLRVIGIDQGCRVDISKFSTNDDGVAISNFVKSLTGRLEAHTVIVCTAANSAHSQGVQFPRFGGTLVCVGLPVGEQKPIASAFLEI